MAIEVKVGVRGLDKVLRNVQRYGERGLRAFGRSLRGEGEQIMTRSKRDFVPVDQGILRSTGHVTGGSPRDTLGRFSGKTDVTLAYGGPAAPYAIVQHERLDFRHTVGEAKYLERPAMDAVPGMAQRVAQDVKGAIEGGGE